MPAPESHGIQVHLDRILTDRNLTLTELAERVGVSIVNLSLLKNGHAKAVRFTTLGAICDVLGCQPGELLSHRSDADEQPSVGAGKGPRGSRSATR
jgi:putative transcriptional regulator